MSTISNTASSVYDALSGQIAALDRAIVALDIAEQYDARDGLIPLRDALVARADRIALRAGI